MTYGFVFVRPDASFEARVFYDESSLSFINIGEVILLSERLHQVEKNRPAAEVDEVSKHLSNDEPRCNVQQGWILPPC